MEKKVTILVSSCDLFKDCWRPFIASIKHNWSDCPFDILIISNNDELQDDVVKFIKVGEDKGWASNLKLALKNITTPYILYMQEDYWLTSPISTDLFMKQVEYSEINHVDYLRMSFPFMDNDKIDDEHALSNITKDKYALCLQTVLFKRDILYKILVDGWSGWDYEANISDYLIRNKITIRSEVLLSSVNPQIIFNYPTGTAVRKGRWTVAGRDFLSKNGFSDLIKYRQTEGLLMHYMCIFRGRFYNSPLHFIASAGIRLMLKMRWNF